MTYIEFFDRTAVENVCACLTSPPERVILVGDSKRTLEKHAARYAKIFENRGMTIEFIPCSVNRNSIESIIEALSNIVNTYDDCVFDLTGGEELYLVATGIISERYKDKHIQMHRFNVCSGTITDCDLDNITISEKPHPEMTVDENIRVYGGDIIWDDDKPNATHSWDLNDEFRSDMAKMWSLCRKDVRTWNAVITELGKGYTDYKDEDGLTTTVIAALIAERSHLDCNNFSIADTLIGKLYAEDLIVDYDYDGTYLTVRFKNEQIKRCLTKAGQLLELKIFDAALNVCDKNGEYFYNDVMCGVCIDWDGKIHVDMDSYDTENEIDVMLMRGIIPLFVSCKNGTIEMEELYKLDAVATQFGGKYARKILVATAIDTAGHVGEYIKQRAEDMGIKIVSNIQELNDAGIMEEVRNFMVK